MRPSQLFAAVVALASVSAASQPKVSDNLDAFGQLRNVLYGRQDNENSATTEPTPSADPEPTPAESTPAEGEESASDSPTATNTEENSETTPAPSGSATGKESGTTRKVTATNKEFDARLPAGGIQMVTPAAIAGPQFYKVGDWITFGWNYTSLKVTPSAIDILATCTANQATYTIAVNQSVEETGRALWDTGSVPSDNPLLTEMYTLLIYDAESSVSATARPGYLAVYNQHQFGMYTKQPYTPWADFKCANCNGGLSPFEQLTLKALLITGGTTVASLLYFSHSFGIL